MEPSPILQVNRGKHCVRRKRRQRTQPRTTVGPNSIERRGILSVNQFIVAVSSRDRCEFVHGRDQCDSEFFLLCMTTFGSGRSPNTPGI